MIPCPYWLFEPWWVRFVTAAQLMVIVPGGPPCSRHVINPTKTNGVYFRMTICFGEGGKLSFSSGFRAIFRAMLKVCKSHKTATSMAASLLYFLLPHLSDCMKWLALPRHGEFSAKYVLDHGDKRFRDRFSLSHLGWRSFSTVSWCTIILPSSHAKWCVC